MVIGAVICFASAALFLGLYIGINVYITKKASEPLQRHASAEIDRVHGAGTIADHRRRSRLRLIPLLVFGLLALGGGIVLAVLA